MHGRLSGIQQRRRRLRDVLLGLGASEAMTDTFLHEGDLDAVGLSPDVIRITNPLVADEDVLRPTLRPGLLRAVAFNESHRRGGVALFEVGHVYPPGDRSTELPPEYEALGLALAGRDATAAMAAWREIAGGLGAPTGQRPPAPHPFGRAART
jgi:phenylalanyl-tRNA synthetase beta chain